MYKNLTLALLLAACSFSSARATELVVLTAENYSRYVPRGKEVDAVCGDYVLRNDWIVAVIARPSTTRHANMTVRDVGGCLIDLSRRVGQRSRVADGSDQLSCFYPTGSRYLFTDPAATQFLVDGQLIDWNSEQVLVGGRVEIQITGKANSDQSVATVSYSLDDANSFVQVQTTITNPTGHALAVPLRDAVRADRTFTSGVDEPSLAWVDDSWFHKSYGILSPNLPVRRANDNRLFFEYMVDGQNTVSVESQGQYSWTRQVFPADNLLQLRGLAREVGGEPPVRADITIADSPAGPGIDGALLTLLQEGRPLGSARSAGQRQINFLISPGSYTCRVEAMGRPTIEEPIEIRPGRSNPFTLYMEPNALVSLTVTDEQGRRLPCKAAFHGVSGTEDPYFGPDSAAYGVHNLQYSAIGRPQASLGPGRYEVIVSHGPEFDAVVKTIDVGRGDELEIPVTLTRSVDTPGWVSAEYHSHSSPSGDNTSDQMGRVLNLLAEHLEFAPCTEHNRIDSYLRHLKYWDVEALMATCSGIELTGNPLPVNHQNAFPLKWQAGYQDGGGPTPDVDPFVQIERLAMWDDASEKLVQMNHPNLMQVLGDRDTDHTADEGFKQMFKYVDVIEVHPLDTILRQETTLPQPGTRGNAMFNWMQLINQGYRIPGVVNTDAHYNFHGSGWLRNYVASSTDDPAEVDTMEMVRNSSAGRILMTNGPFMTVEIHGRFQGQPVSASIGEEIRCDVDQVTARIRVQCPNWIDVNRIQVFLNGRPVPELNFTQRTHAEKFQPGSVKFDQSIPIPLQGDAHVIVAAAGEGLQLGRVMGPTAGQAMPMAVSNPIYVDWDGNGFQPSGDTLGAPITLRDD